MGHPRFCARLAVRWHASDVVRTVTTNRNTVAPQYWGAALRRTSPDQTLSQVRAKKLSGPPVTTRRRVARRGSRQRLGCEPPALVK